MMLEAFKKLLNTLIQLPLLTLVISLASTRPFLDSGQVCPPYIHVMPPTVPHYYNRVNNEYI